MKMRRSLGEHLFDKFNVIFMIVMSIIMVYPFWYILCLAFNTGADAARGPIWFFPRDFTLENFKYVFRYPNIPQAAFITVARCIAAPVFSVTVNMLAAFTLSKRWLPFRKLIVFFLMGPMFIGGTVVSNYLVMAKLGLLNNFLVFVIPGAFGYFNALIMRSSIDGLPPELQESAFLDGAGYGTIFFRIILPLSKPVIAAFLFFSVVANWLDLGTNLLYITKKSLYTLQWIMYLAINSTEAKNIIIDPRNRNTAQQIAEMAKQSATPTPQVIRMAILVVVTFPILFVYPFFQKYFVKGMLTGSVKA